MSKLKAKTESEAADTLERESSNTAHKHGLGISVVEGADSFWTKH